MIDDLGRVSHVDALLTAVGPVAGLAIADIGCGEGALGRELASQGADVTGFDPFIEPARRSAVGTGFWQLVRATAQALPTPDASFDLALFVFSLHHVPQQQLAWALAEARRVLRRDGRLYVAEPVAEGPHQYIVELFHDETSGTRRSDRCSCRSCRAPFWEPTRPFLCRCSPLRQLRRIRCSHGCKYAVQWLCGGPSAGARGAPPLC